MTNKYVDQAKEANAKDLEEARLKATQALLLEKENKTRELAEQLDRVLEGINKNLEQVGECDDIRFLNSLSTPKHSQW